MNWYNDNEPFIAQWLRNLIAAGHLPQGTVNERSIAEVKAEELAGYSQCHFFAGIGGWPLALKLAGWPADAPVWTGSCPCQPLSCAGKRGGELDKRHLWPVWFELIKVRRPTVIFGEQVASKDGREWLAGVRADLEAIGYAVGAADLCAAGVGAPHIRQRLFWVAESPGEQVGTGRQSRQDGHGSRMADSRREKRGGRGISKFREGSEKNRSGTSDIVRGSSAAGGVGNSESRQQRGVWERGARQERRQLQAGGSGANDPWSDFEWLPCSDGKYRRTQSGICPLVDGFPGRLGQLRAYGNSICVPVAVEFIKAFMQ